MQGQRGSKENEMWSSVSFGWEEGRGSGNDLNFSLGLALIHGVLSGKARREGARGILQ